jgi:hypothetical protein
MLVKTKRDQALKYIEYLIQAMEKAHEKYHPQVGTLWGIKVRIAEQFTKLKNVIRA